MPDDTASPTTSLAGSAHRAELWRAALPDAPAGGPAAVLWDMDGTLVDTEPYWYRAEVDLVAAHGGRWTEADALAVIGFDLLDSAAYLQRVGGVDLPAVEIVDLMIDRVVEQMADDPPWQPGALDLLADLREAGLPCVLVTMSWRRLAAAVVQMLPPGTFAAVVVGDEVARGKPHAEPYLAAAAAVGAAPGRCLALEDSPTGVASARAAGCFVVGVPHMVELPAGAVDVVVPTLEGLDAAALRRMFSG